jgi:hypothetical protein
LPLCKVLGKNYDNMFSSKKNAFFIKEEEEWKEKRLLIRPSKMCLLFFKKCFTWESMNFSKSFLQFFYLKFLISTCVCLWLHRCHQNMYKMCGYSNTSF